MTTNLPFALSAPALNHDGNITPFTEYVKLFNTDPKHSANINYALSQLPSDSKLLGRERITVNYETGEFTEHAKRLKEKKEKKEKNEPIDLAAPPITADDAAADDEDELPITLERLNIKVVFDEFKKCLNNTGYEFELSHSDLTYDGLLPDSYRVIYTVKNHKAMICFTIGSSGWVHVDIQSDNESIISNILTITTKESIKYRSVPEDGDSYIYFICRNEQGYFTHPFEISDGINFDEIFDNYEDDFKDNFSDVILKKLTDFNYNKGIVLLHGVPGTGKTTYLRYILSKIKKKVMYLPPEMGHAISDPGFITFLMSNPNAVLCIEDAENIIKTREAGANQAVSNILNITDGLLGSALKYQVICTFNAEYTEIDSALKRKGRMIGKYEFKALSSEKTRKLVKKLYGNHVEPLKPSMTLADIHGMMEDMPSHEKPEKVFGFI